MAGPHGPDRAGGRGDEPDGRRDDEEDERRELLRTRVDHADACVIVRVSGEIDFSTANLLRTQVINAAAARTPQRVVVDLHEVAFCDSSGLGALVAIWRAVRAGGGRIVLARPPEQCREILRRTGLDTRLTVRDRLPDAIEAAAEPD